MLCAQGHAAISVWFISFRPCALASSLSISLLPPLPSSLHCLSLTLSLLLTLPHLFLSCPPFPSLWHPHSITAINLFYSSLTSVWSLQRINSFGTAINLHLGAHWARGSASISTSTSILPHITSTFFLPPVTLTLHPVSHPHLRPPS